MEGSLGGSDAVESASYDVLCSECEQDIQPCLPPACKTCGYPFFGAVIGPAIAGYMIAMGVSVAMNFVVFALPLGLAGVIALKIKTD